MTQEYHPRSVQDDIAASLRRQPVGATGATVADLNLPDDYLRRVADRVIRTTFQKSFRIVVGESTEPGAIPAVAQDGKLDTKTVKVCSASLRPPIREYRAGLKDGPPPLPGYRAPILDNATDLWPAAVPTGDPRLATAGQLVATRLARDGLMATTLRAVETIGPAHIGNRAQRMKTLRRVGLPVDLLEFFEGGDKLVERAIAAIQGDSTDPSRLSSRTRALLDEVSAAAFKFRPTVASFKAHAETGTLPVRFIRLHATRAEYWGGRGAGSSLDVIRQLAELCPAARVVVCAEEAIVPPLAHLMSAWPKPARLAIAAGKAPLSQWAQDNGKPGKAGARRVTLLPRYASRAEQDTAFVPGDTFIADSLAAADVDVAQSPLLFQGGNLVVARTPKGETALLLGEAEVSRNVCLGLTREQALEALRLEFGADQAVVLPAASFHIDSEFCLREHEGRLLAFVNDSLAASLSIAQSGIGALQASGSLTQPEQLRLRGALTRMLPVDLVAALGPIMNRLSVGPGAFPTPLAAAFSTAPTDSGVGNLQTFLLALDLVGSSRVDLQACKLEYSIVSPK